MDRQRRFTPGELAAYGRAAEMTAVYHLQEQLFDAAGRLKGAPDSILQPVLSAVAELRYAHEAWLSFEEERSPR